MNCNFGEVTKKQEPSPYRILLTNREMLQLAKNERPNFDLLDWFPSRCDDDGRKNYPYDRLKAFTHLYKHACSERLDVTRTETTTNIRVTTPRTLAFDFQADFTVELFLRREMIRLCYEGKDVLRDRYYAPKYVIDNTRYLTFFMPFIDAEKFGMIEKV